MCKVPGPGPLPTAPLWPRYAPAVDGSSAEVTDQSELPAPSLYPAAQHRVPWVN